MTKYKSVATEVDGVRFASKKEAHRYGELKLLEKAGLIVDLRLQPKFPLYVTPHAHVEGIAKIGAYVGDFAYEEAGHVVIEDVKGFKTPLYRWKKKHVEAQYGVKIVEI